MKTKIAVTTTTFGEFDPLWEKKLEEYGIHAVVNQSGHKLSSDEIHGFVKGCSGIIAGTEQYTSKVLRDLKGLKVISRCGTGLDNIDLETAARQGVDIYNTPNAPVPAVAELTVGLILDMLRNICGSDKTLRAGLWNKQMGWLLSGKKVGIVGFGRIGRRVGALCGAFGCEVGYYDRVSFKDRSAFKSSTLDELLAWADIVTLHCPASKDRTPILGRKELFSMKKGSWLVNTARAELLDEIALVEALRDGHLAGAAVDVFPHEPYSGLLLKSDKVVLTPHIGSYAREARAEMEKEAIENLIKGLQKVRCI